jgi:hypothetical protein
LGHHLRVAFETPGSDDDCLRSQPPQTPVGTAHFETGYQPVLPHNQPLCRCFVQDVYAEFLHVLGQVFDDSRASAHRQQARLLQRQEDRWQVIELNPFILDPADRFRGLLCQRTDVPLVR